MTPYLKAKMSAGLLQFSVCFSLLFCTHTLSAQVISTFAGSSPTFGIYNGDGIPATAAEVGLVSDAAIDSKGNVYFSNDYNRIRKVNTAGIISTVAGGDSLGFSGDGGPATAARLDHPFHICIDRFDNIYFIDAYRIRKIDTNGIIATYAGTGVSGYSGNGGPATNAQIWPESTGITVDSSGDVYFVDNRVVIRKIERATGLITLFAGNGANGYSGDGGVATAASFSTMQYYPMGLYADLKGNIFVADGGNNRIRRIDKWGIITTFAGTGSAGSTGDGGPATSAMIYNPLYVTGDVLGNIYFNEHNREKIRRIDSAGIVEQIAGDGSKFFAGSMGSMASMGDGGPATAGRFVGISGLAIDRATNNLYVSDSGWCAVRLINFSATAPSPLPLNVMINPNPAHTELVVQGAATGKAVLYDISGKVALSKDHLSDRESINITNLPAGYYIIQVANEQGQILKTQKVLKN